MLVYRVFAWLADAKPGEPGHPLYIHRAGQRLGRFDNRHLYGAMYVAMSSTGAIGERFQNLPRWERGMLRTEHPPGGELMLANLSLDEDTHPLLDLDDAKQLDARGYRPSDIVKRNRPVTQRLAAEVFDEGVWSGMTWWSMHRASWQLAVRWDHTDILDEQLEGIPGHPGLRDAARHLAKDVDPEMF